MMTEGRRSRLFGIEVVRCPCRRVGLLMIPYSNSKIRTNCAIAVFGFLLALPVDGQVLETEPNDSMVTATVMAFGGVYSGQIAAEDDQDYFELTVAEAGVVSVSFEAGPELLHAEMFRVELIAPDGTILDGLGSDEGVPQELVALVSDATVYVKVSGGSYSRIRLSDERYQITATFAAGGAPVETEPNDSMVTATPITVGGEYTGRISTYVDMDYFVVDVPRVAKSRWPFSPGPRQSTRSGQ